ncbi:hypothetical protein [Kribbella sp. NPDC051718]|uniref:hypothetical protein n=1 Tax=Kribbella sp. NPDC051718 TaxID=3155168 RepID=UPI00341F1907
MNHTLSASIVGALARAGRYCWDNSESPAVISARAAVDRAEPWTRRDVRLHSSRFPADLTFTYAGPGKYATYFMPFLELRRSQLAVPPGPSEADADSLVDTDIMLELHVGGPPKPVRTGEAAAPRFLLPSRLQFVVPTTPRQQGILPGLPRKVRQSLARQRVRHDRDLVITNSAEKFHDFYYNYYLPTMESRHGPAARGVDPGTAYGQIFKRGALFLLTEQKVPVAGMACRLEPRTRTLRTRLFGVSGGEISRYLDDATIDLNVRILEWAASNGYDFVDLSTSEPFASKGTFQFKRKLRPIVTPARNHFSRKYVTLSILRDRPAVRSFLAANPIVTLSPDGTLQPISFHDTDLAPPASISVNAAGLRPELRVDLDELFGTSTN